jgi:hypothetical protein
MSFANVQRFSVQILCPRHFRHSIPQMTYDTVTLMGIHAASMLSAIIGKKSAVHKVTTDLRSPSS